MGARSKKRRIGVADLGTLKKKINFTYTRPYAGILKTVSPKVSGHGSPPRRALAPSRVRATCARMRPCHLLSYLPCLYTNSIPGPGACKPSNQDSLELSARP